MKRGQRNVEARPEAARRRKPFSKIEARLRQRRDKIDKSEETSNFSPRTIGKKRDSVRSSRSSMTSSSESDVSPRLMTSKQHVELVNFESRKCLPVPRFRKLPENFVKKIEAISVGETIDESRETNKNQSRTVVKKEENEKISRKAIKTLIHDDIFESKIKKRSETRNEHFEGKPSKMIDPKFFEEDALKKRRSRSAPCNPLFKIKCAKDKCPRNLIVARKSLVVEEKMTEEIPMCRKNCYRGLRISRSGEVNIASVEGPRVADRNVDRSNLKISESRREEFETILRPKNFESKKLQRDESESSFFQENTKLAQDSQSPLNIKNRQSIQREDIESSSNLINRKSLQHQNVESPLNLKNRRSIQREAIESSLNLMHRQSVEEIIIESSVLQENSNLLQNEDIESPSQSKNTELLRKEDIESRSNQKIMPSAQQKEVHSYALNENITLLQNEGTESSLQTNNTESLRKEDIESCSNPKNVPSLQQNNVESYALQENIKLLQNEDPESSSDAKNTPLLQRTTESSSNLKNQLSLQQEVVDSSSHPRNNQQLQQADTASISLAEDESKSSKNHEKIKNREEMKYKEEKNVNENVNSKQELPAVKAEDKAQEDRNFVSQEGVKEDISRLAESPERRNEPEKRCSPRKPPKKRAFKWETMLEKQHQQSSSRSPENRNESSEIPTKIQEENKFDFWSEKEANCSRHCRCPRSRVKSLEDRKLVAYSAIREELPKILMKRRYLDPTINHGKKIEGTKTKNWQKKLGDSANQGSSPERPRESISCNSRLSQRFVENFAKRWDRRDCSTSADKSQLGDWRFGKKNSRDIEESAKRDLEKNLKKQRNSPKKNKVGSDSPLSPRNFEEPMGTKKIFGASVVKRRSSPSPRRVTFRLPGRVIEENSVVDEEDNSRNGRNFKKLIREKCTSDSDNAENEEVGWSEKNYQSEKKSEKNYNFEQERSSFVGDNLRKHDEISNSCVEERSRKLRSANTLTVTRMKNLQNMRWPSPSCLAGEEQRDENETDDSEQDWETPAGEDVYRTQEVTYPKETREAMKILMRAKENVSRCIHSDHCHKKIDRREILRRKEDYLRAEKSPERNATPVSSYANALAKFQEGCYLDSNRSICGTSQRRVSRNPNVVGEIVEKSRNESRNIGRKDTRLRRDNSINFVHVQSGKLRDNVGRRNTEQTMQSNGSESGNSENGVDRTGWTVGLINGKFKYLTAETFGFKINANGASLKKKQLWTLEGSEHQVFLRSHLDRYLAVDQFGNVTCEAEDPSDPGCAFQIQLASDGSGRWALKNVQRGYFLGSSQDELKCMAKAPGEAEYWLVHLAARPQVNLRSAGRKRFAHLSASQDEIHVDAPVPWGEDTLFTLEFRAAATADNEAGPGHGHGGKAEGGHYALHTCNNKYLARDGKLLDACTRECLYAAEFHAGLLALRDIHGAYLAPIGSKAVLKSRSTTVTRDELFSLEESLPQASFVAALNQRYVSVKQGVDVTANQDEISGHETFQLEFDRVTKRWYVRTMQDRYWSLEAGGGIQASDHKRSSNALFDLAWQPEDGTVALRANNGKFLATKRSGHLYANADSPDGGDSDVSKYYFYLMNRPILVLRCEQGFVGPKSAASPKLECNKAGYETIRVERCERGVVRFKGQNGKYWHADSEGVTVDSDLPAEGFYLELREPSRLCIKCTDGRYLTAGKNGALRLGETDHDSATKWEF